MMPTNFTATDGRHLELIWLRYMEAQSTAAEDGYSLYYSDWEDFRSDRIHGKVFKRFLECYVFDNPEHRLSWQEKIAVAQAIIDGLNKDIAQETRNNEFVELLRRNAIKAVEEIQQWLQRLPH